MPLPVIANGVRSLRLVMAALLLGSALGIARQPATVVSATPSNPADSKISPWVLTHIAQGETAEFLVVLSRQADLGGAAALTTKAEKGRFVYETLRRVALATQPSLLAWLDEQGVPHRAYYIVNAVWVQGDLALARALAEREDVARVDGNPQLTAVLAGEPARPAPAVAPTAPASVEPNILYTNADDVWGLGFTGQGIVIGGQDTGYDWDHPALQPHYRGWDGLTADHNYNWRDSIHSGGGSCGPDTIQPCDDGLHGTHTMGIALGDDGGANQIGMAPGAEWIGCRNMNQGVGSPATYLECFEFFLAPYPITGTAALDGNPDLAPDVTNNSWVCPDSEGCQTNTLLAAVQAQRAAGIMTVVSAGNSGASGCDTVDDPPAHHAEVYTVGALNTGTDIIANFSSRGPVSEDGSNRRKPDITAPGTDVRSSVPSGYASLDGTSMAAPHVAGAVALLWSAYPVLKGQISLTEQILNQTAVHIPSTDCGSSGWPNNTYGYGRLDVLAAVEGTPSGSGGLTGLVSNGVTNEPLAGAALQATLSTTPTLQFQFSNHHTGYYTQTVFSGTYTLTVTAPGFVPVTLGGISVATGLTTTQLITLTPGSLTFFPVILGEGVASSSAATAVTRSYR